MSYYVRYDIGIRHVILHKLQVRILYYHTIPYSNVNPPCVRAHVAPLCGLVYCWVAAAAVFKHGGERATVSRDVIERNFRVFRDSIKTT